MENITFLKKEHLIQLRNSKQLLTKSVSLKVAIFNLINRYFCTSFFRKKYVEYHKSYLLKRTKNT